MGTPRFMYNDNRPQAGTSIADQLMEDPNFKGGPPLSCRRHLFHSDCPMGKEPKERNGSCYRAQMNASQRVEGE
jgi:hypothetical protein